MKRAVIIVVILLITICGFFWVQRGKTTKVSIEKRGDATQNKIKEPTTEPAVLGTIWASDYSMNWELDEEKDSLHEEVNIKIVNTSEDSVSQLYFRNMAPAIVKYDKENYSSKANKQKKSSIKSVQLNGKNVDEICYEKDKSVFSIHLEEELKPKQTVEVLIRCQTDIPERQDRFSVQKVAGGKMYALSFCYPYLAPYRNGVWNKDPYFDDGESRANEVSNYHVTVKAPEDYLVAATGKHRTEDGTTTVEGKQIRDFAMVLCNSMKLETYEVSGIQVNNFYLPGKYVKRYRKITRLVLEDTIGILTEKIGVYPYETIDIAPCIFGLSYGGMEFPGLCMNNATAYVGKGTITAKTDPLSLMEVVSHELAHQWFYAAVGSDEYKEAWLDEGFTSYCEKILYGTQETKSLQYANTYADPKIDLEQYRKEYKELVLEQEKSHKKNYLNVSVKEYTEDDSYGEREYDGSVLFLCELKNAMGEDDFLKFLRKYYNDNQFKVVNSQTVVSTIESVEQSEKVRKIIEKYIK